MTTTKFVKATVLATLVAASNFAVAQDSTFEKDFVNKTLLGNWKAQTVTKNEQVRSVDASRDIFLDNILGKLKAIKPENKTALGNVDASLRLYTGQFEQYHKS